MRPHLIVYRFKLGVIVYRFERGVNFANLGRPSPPPPLVKQRVAFNEGCARGRPNFTLRAARRQNELRFC
jgi:hypothetical protein